MSDLSNVRVNGQRLWDSLMEMAQDRRHAERRLQAPHAHRRRQAGTRTVPLVVPSRPACTLKIDEMGNMFARRAGVEDDLPPVVLGSHLDTQPTGGKFDGVLGVLGALEVVRSLNDLNIKTRHPIEVANWTNEEGSRFAPAMVSSGVFAGVYTKEFAYSRLDPEGKTLGDELERIGFKGEEPVGGRPVHAYFELHIEQGPILEDEGYDVGIVTHGQGQRWYELKLTGFESHAGSTPMPVRKDALLGAARVVELVNAIGLSKAPLGVSTCGMINAYPNSRNVIPGEVFLACEFRHPIDATLTRDGRGAARRRQGDLRQDRPRPTISSRSSTTRPSPSTRTASARCVGRPTRFGYKHRDIVSGAGHDACYMARVTPTSMIFTPCVDGVSHNESEDIKLEWSTAGANVLLHAALEKAEIVG